MNSSEKLLGVVKRYFEDFDSDQPPNIYGLKELSATLKMIRDDVEIDEVGKVNLIDTARAAIREYQAIWADTSPRHFELYEIIRRSLKLVTEYKVKK